MIQVTDGYNTALCDPIDYIDHMGDDNRVCDAARVSFNKVSIQYTEEQNAKLINYLAKHDHWSPFAHCFMSFRFRAPMFVARQFQKHVVGFAWNEVSRRYVDTPPTFFVPHSYRKRPDNMKQGSVEEDQVFVQDDVLDSYVNEMREHTRDYKTLINQGVCPEQARMFMPQSMMTEWIWTGSLIAWARFYKLRSDSHAQKECEQYAEAVRWHMLKYFRKSTDALLELNNA
tara:strand:+ start:6906 stop:7592 length:687 start_codon:yes stop_codon:yes gene_type:complete